MGEDKNKVLVPVSPPESCGSEYTVLAEIYPEHAVVDFGKGEVRLPHRDRDVSYSRVRFEDIIRLAEIVQQSEEGADEE